jgi:hypothetical protein
MSLFFKDGKDSIFSEMRAKKLAFFGDFMPNS